MAVLVLDGMTCDRQEYVLQRRLLQAKVSRQYAAFGKRDCHSSQHRTSTFDFNPWSVSAHPRHVGNTLQPG